MPECPGASLPSSLVRRHIWILLLALRRRVSYEKMARAEMWQKMPSPLFLTRWTTCLHLQDQAHPHSEIISSPGQGISQEALAHTTLAGFQPSLLCLGVHARELGLHLILLMTIKIWMVQETWWSTSLNLRNRPRRGPLSSFCAEGTAVQKNEVISLSRLPFALSGLLIYLIPTFQPHRLTVPARGLPYPGV